MNPRTLWACQPVAFIISFSVAPSARFSRSRAFSVLVPWRAPSAFILVAFLGALVRFFEELAFLPDLPLTGATCGFRGVLLAFFVASGSLATASTWDTS